MAWYGSWGRDLMRWRWAKVLTSWCVCITRRWDRFALYVHVRLMCCGNRQWHWGQSASGNKEQNCTNLTKVRANPKWMYSRTWVTLLVFLKKIRWKAKDCSTLFLLPPPPRHVQTNPQSYFHCDNTKIILKVSKDTHCCCSATCAAAADSWLGHCPDNTPGDEKPARLCRSLAVFNWKSPSNVEALTQQIRAKFETDPESASGFANRGASASRQRGSLVRKQWTDGVGKAVQ